MKIRDPKFVHSLIVAFSFLVVIWGVHLFHVVSGVRLGVYGIYPREIFGLRGILFSPIIHSDWQHLISNSAPLLVLTIIIFFFYPKVASRSYIMIYILTGVAVWLFARKVFHIGASGVVYGLLAFVFWSGIFRRSLRSIVLALIVTFLYSGYFAGILPNQEGISWESHLIGGLIGIFTAFWYKEELEKDETPKPPQWTMEPEEEPQYFLRRDSFDKTRQEREQEKRNPSGGGWFSNDTFR
jgi:membrane associated rhomboid family serine protease